MFSSFGPALGNVVLWDGENTRALSNGLPNAPVVHIRAMGVHNQELYCASTYYGWIMRWDGAQWVFIGFPQGGQVSAFGSFNGELIVAGSFTAVTNIAAAGVAAWSGTGWRALDSGIGGSVAAEPPSVSALAVFRGELIAGGSFTTAGGQNANCIARWNGAEWSPAGAGILPTAPGGGGVQSLLEFGGSLAAAGRFDLAGGAPALNVARWDGLAWTAMNIPNRAGSLVNHDGRLHVFESDRRLHEWNGSTWNVAAPAATDSVSTAVSFEGQIVAGGSFYGVGELPVSYFAAWDGSSWRAGVDRGYVGSDPLHVASLGTQVFLSGTILGIGTIPARFNAVWDGASWTSVDLPFRVYTSAVDGSRLILAASNRLAYWDGAGLTLGPLYPYTHLGPNIGSVVPFNGGVVIGGYIDDEGEPPIRNVAFWNGNTWSRLGDGLPTPPSDLEVYQGSLVACIAYGGPLLGVVRWDGRKWAPMGSFPRQIVMRLQLFNGDLIAGGYTVARWDGADWVQLGSGLRGGAVGGLTVRGQELIAWGTFTSAGGQPADGLAAWDGSSWRALGRPESQGLQLAGHGEELIAIGSFDRIGEQPAAGIARWTCDSCYANCDGSTLPVLTVNDFVCFLQRYAAGDPRANCDGSAGVPALTVADFTCFLRAYGAGCP